MKLLVGMGFGLVCAAAVASSASASSFRDYAPTFGAPFTGGASSFDYTNWSYADNVLTNNASTNRTWTVPFVTDNAVAGVSESVWAEMANVAGTNTTGQAITNFGQGGRMTSLAPVNNTCAAGSLCDTFLGSVTVPNDGTAYVNFIVAHNGGKIARSQITQ